jgi:hypothetical protein
VNATWLQLAASTALATVIVAVINGFLQRRKVSADTTKTLTDAAGGFVERIDHDNERLRTDNRRLEQGSDKRDEFIDLLLDERVELRKQIREHADWDENIKTIIFALAPHVDLPECPPLDFKLHVKPRFDE